MGVKMKMRNFCARCGAPRGQHRATDKLCPARSADGEVIIMGWEQEGARTTFKQHALPWEKDDE